MTRYYSEAELLDAVRRQVAIDRMYRSSMQSAVATQNRSWLQTLVGSAIRLVFGAVVGEVLAIGVDAAWDYFADLFSG